MTCKIWLKLAKSVVWEKKKKSDSLQCWQTTQRNWSGNLIGTSGLGQSYKCTGNSDKVLELTYLRHYRTGLIKVVVSQFLIKALLMPVTLLFEVWPKSASAATFSSFNYSNQSYKFCVRKPCQNQYVSFHLKRRIIDINLTFV